MKLQIVMGRADTEKSDYILEEIRGALKENPVGKPIFYIVPEQMTFQQEHALLQGEIRGTMRAQVVSFSRLALRVLQETGGTTKQFISSIGIQMMLRKIVDQGKGRFDFFGKVIDKQGFIQELEGIVTEFKRHCVTPEMLAEQIKYAAENVLLSNKLTDLHYIYENLVELLKDKYIDGEDQLQLLTEKISETDSLQDAEIFIEGFYRFTPKELGIIAELLKVCKKVTITLTMDPAVLGEKADELDLFYQTTETYHKLKQLASEQAVVFESPIILDPAKGRFQDRPYFQHLEENFDERPAPTLTLDKPIPVKLGEAIHPRAEIDGMIQEMLRLVRDEGYRYRDFVIYIREGATYNNLIEQSFADYNIPVFIDEKRTMLNHPLIEFIRSAFELVESNWRYDAVFRLLKTGFIPATDEVYPLDTDAIDLLENYVLEYGIRRKNQWLNEDQWIYKRFRGLTDTPQTSKEAEREKRINAYRYQVTAALADFDKEIRSKSTVREYGEAIYHLLEKLDVPEVLEKNRRQYENTGQIEKAREEEQAWNGFISLLDEMVEMIGTEKLSFKMMKASLEAGLDALEFAHVPPSIDHVIVGTIDQSRVAGKKCAFLLGVNEGSWPMKPAIDGMINETEREFLKQFGMELAESSRRILLDDQFYMYLAFTAPTDYLWVSYVISDNEGKVKIASPMISRLQEFFPELGGPDLLQDPDELQAADRFITTNVKTRASLNMQLARYLRGYKMDPVWWSVLQWYVKNESKNETTYKVLQSLFYDNKPGNLSKETVGRLYDRQIKTSVSRLEMHYRCSYQHFAQYSLQLEERRVHKLDAPNMGELFHEALKMIVNSATEEKKLISELTSDDVIKYARNSMTSLAPKLQHNILSSSKRYAFIQKKLEEIIIKAMFILVEQAKNSGFTPVGVELGFGLDDRGTAGKLSPKAISLPNGYEMLLRGRIDRVDSLQTADEHLYLRIIDYKSSSRGLSLTDAYYGLSMQMLTYLDVVLSQSKTWLEKEAKPGGVLYFHVHKPMLSADELLEDQAIEREIFKKYKMSGLVLSDVEIAKQMDTSLDRGYSDIAPIALTAKGGFYANASVTDEEGFTSLRDHMNELIKQAGIDITSGEIKLNPFEYKQQNACTFCDFKSVCQFDPALKENDFRRLEPIDEKDFLTGQMSREDILGEGVGE